MDAQNASEVDQSKSATATRRRASDAESKRSSKSVDQQLTASPEAKSSKPKVAPSLSKTTDTAEADIDERDSDAETIVLPGKDGHSPSKVRKMKQDVNTFHDGDIAKHSKAHLDGAAGARTESGSKSVDSSKRRRPSTSAPRDKNHLARSKDGSSGLSSAPASPPRDGRALHRRRRSNASPHRSSDSEVAANRVSSGKSTNDRLKLGDRLPSAKRKAPRTDSEDEDDHHRKARRQRTTSISNEASRPQRERFSESRNRSHSPPTRLHRRSASTQLVNASSGGLSQKKRRLPPPLQSTDQHSDDSDRSGSPLPRSSKLRSLATPATADANVSPAKIMPPKKHLDAHGQTFLARACARGEYDAVKKRLGERPEDINVADYAGNTPLQIAAINGCEDIVKLLIDAGCNMDCVNYDKDTPLLDAVDNGHLGVVKLLLDAGVNPRKANVSGQEPIDRITDETENADEIRKLLLDARKRAGERRRTSEDRHSHPDSHDARDSHAPDSPRHSPAITLAGHTGRRSGTGRATKTRNDLLYMPLDDKTLRQAAGRGDEETVARILQVKEGCNDPECMVAAARGGHDLVIQLLLGLGSANPDPGPVPSLQPEFATPILAAIGQENIKVVELLLEQGGFDPTRRFKGDTYYEIARKRQGTNWKEEENLLKNAYDEYKRTHKDVARTGKSPGRREREREREREEKRARREEASRDESRVHKRNMSSPTRDNEGRKKLAPQRITSPKERRRLEPGRHAKEDRTSSTHTSDRETSPTVSHKASKAKSREADAAVSSDGEALKPRRKLVSKGELRGEREKHRRSSMASNASLKEPSSPQEPRAEDPAADKPKMSEKYHDRTKALKREESKDPAANGNDGQAKRYRSSVTPDGHNHGEKDDAVPQKRRRLDADGQEKRSRPPSSPESRHAKLSASRDGSKVSGKASRKSIEDEANKDAKDSHHKRESTRKDSARPANESSVRVKREDDDVQMPDVETLEASSSEPQDKKKRRELAEQEETKKELDRQQTEAKRQADERKRAEARQEEERKRVEAEESKLREEEEVKRRKLAEKARLEQEEQERAEEEKRRKKKEEEEEEERRKQEEERIRQEEEEKQQEAERKKVEEEERVRRAQLEREAADAARRKREEDQRKERERRERVAREEIERKRAAREAEQRRVREEQEKARLDKLPPLMRWLDLHPNPKARVVAERFRQVQGCRYDTIDPATNGTAEGREEWVLNTAVALLLGEKDLTLSRYSAWERVPVSSLAKETIWRTEWMHYSLASQQYFDIGREVPGLYPHEPTELTSTEKEDIKRGAWERFRELPMFFVKVSELLYTIPQIPHLHDVMIGVGYRELQEPEGSSPEFKVVSKPFRYLAKHLSDPNMDRYHGRAPRWRWYLNGNFVDEDLPKRAVTSNLPFVERPVPRRGLLAVNSDDPDYLKICREQGITPLMKGQPSPTLTNGSRDTADNASTSQKVNGVHGSNGTLSSPENPAKGSHTVNGINGSS